ncbi:MAG: hypothetical protein K5664_04985 [Firmicutes bacterium]|nr:hypothetical protein [Bacillota bacterium]
MKNVRENQLKKCIFFLYDEFEEVIKDFGISTEIDYDGIAFAKGNEDINNEAVYAILSKHFDIDVTSVHCDDCDYIGVWVVYK